MSKTGNTRTPQPKKRGAVPAVTKTNAKAKTGASASSKSASSVIAKKPPVTGASETSGERAVVKSTTAQSSKMGRQSKSSEIVTEAEKNGDKGPLHKTSKNAASDIVIGVQRREQKRIVHPDITVVWDTETTGLPINDSVPLIQQPTIIEVAAHKYEGRKLVDSIEFLINPGFPLPKGDPNNSKVPNIPKITGITDEMLKDQPKFISYLPVLREWFFGVRRVVGSNPYFDLTLLDFDLQRVGAARAFPYPLEVIDTIQMSLHIRGYRMSLFDLHEHYFKERYPAHRAMPDVIACARCYHHMLDLRKE